MSPLLYIIMRLARMVIVAVAAILVLIVGIFLWQRHGVGGFAFQQGDKGFLVMLALLLAVSLYLVRGIGREIIKAGELP